MCQSVSLLLLVWVPSWKECRPLHGGLGRHPDRWPSSWSVSRVRGRFPLLPALGSLAAQFLPLSRVVLPYNFTL